MARHRHFGARTPSARTLRRAGRARGRKSQTRLTAKLEKSANRKSLLLGTALASTFLLGSLLAPAPVHAAVNCPPGTFPPPGPISIPDPGDDIVCVNVDDRTNNAGTVINLTTNGANEYIYLNNSGVLTAADNDTNAIGILTTTDGNNSRIDIVNNGGIGATATGTDYAFAFGIDALTPDPASPIDIYNAGDITATATAESAYAYGIRARSQAYASSIDVINNGDIRATATGTDTFVFAYGMHVRSTLTNAPVTIVNSGDITATATGDFFVSAYGIFARSQNEYSDLDI